MSTLTYLTTLVQQAISRLNNYEANAKKVDELPHQTALNTNSKIPVSRAGVSEYITVDQIASAIQNGNYNQLLAVGSITVNELTNEIIVASGVTAQINGSIYQTTTDTTIPITLCPAGFTRKDILVLTTSNTVIAISGEETDGAIVLAPPTPLDAIYITEFDVNDTVIGTPGDPVLGAQFKKKIENNRYKSKLSGENVIIPFQAAGQSHYSVTNAALVSVAGFTTAGLTTPMYEGQDVIFENQTGHEITLIDSYGVDTSFVIGDDLIVPNEGKIWFRFRNNELELIDKNWFKINEVATAQNLGEFIDSLDSKTDVKDTDEFVLSDSDDELKSKKTRFLDIKNKLKSYFDTFYLSLSIFNDFVEDVFSSLDNKLDKSSTPSSVYTTDSEGLQVMKPISEFQTPVGDYVTVNTTQIVTGKKTFNDVGLIKKNQTYLFPDQSGGNFYIGGTGGYDRFEFISLDGYEGDGFGSSQIYSNPEDGSGIVHNSLDNQISSMLNINQTNTFIRNNFNGNRTTLYVDGQNSKIKIEGTQNKFATLGTSLITGTKNFEFPNNSGTLALLSDLTDTQNALNLKLPIESPSTTGTLISFTTDKVHGTLTTPETGNITADVTNAKLGVTNIIIHNSGTAPTFGSEFKKLSGSGNYVTGVVNYIYCTYISTTEIIYSINQRA